MRMWIAHGLFFCVIRADFYLQAHGFCHIPQTCLIYINRIPHLSQNTFRLWKVPQTIHWGGCVYEES